MREDAISLCSVLWALGEYELEIYLQSSSWIIIQRQLFCLFFLSLMSRCFLDTVVLILCWWWVTYTFPPGFAYLFTFYWILWCIRHFKFWYTQIYVAFSLLFGLTLNTHTQPSLCWNRKDILLSFFQRF